MLCDGRELSRDQYAELFAVIGTLHGSGDDMTTFNLPDLCGRFLRGVDHGAGNDPDAESRVEAMPGGARGDAVGSLQSDSFRRHHHEYTRMVYDNNVDGVDSTVTHSGEHHLRGGHHTSAAGGNETRPINVSVNWIIRVHR